MLKADIRWTDTLTGRFHQDRNANWTRVFALCAAKANCGEIEIRKLGTESGWLHFAAHSRSSGLRHSILGQLLLHFTLHISQRCNGKRWRKYEHIKKMDMIYMWFNDPCRNGTITSTGSSCANEHKERRYCENHRVTL